MPLNAVNGKRGGEAEKEKETAEGTSENRFK